MGSCRVEVVLVLANERVQVPVAKQKNVVKHLAPCGSDKSFRRGIHLPLTMSTGNASFRAGGGGNRRRCRKAPRLQRQQHGSLGGWRARWGSGQGCPPKYAVGNRSLLKRSPGLVLVRAGQRACFRQACLNSRASWAGRGYGVAVSRAPG